MGVRVEVHVEDEGDEVTVSIESSRVTPLTEPQAQVATLVDRASAAAREAVLRAPTGRDVLDVAVREARS